ncbi:MAG: hypothetical protein FH751_13910 [Firmicutes bacterium]|nr:hypothetical protein [Bacillota bacterium]
MRKTRKKQKKPVMFFLLLIVLLIVFFGGSFKNLYELITKEDKTAKEVVSIDVSNNIKEIKLFDDGLLFRNNKTIKSYHLNGKLNWSKEAKDLSELNNNIFISDNSEISSFDIDGNSLWKVNTNKRIMSMIEDKGHLFVFTKNKKDLLQIDVIDEFGNTISNVVIDKKPLLAYMNKDKKSFIVTTLGVEDNTIVSEILAYKLDGSKIYSYSLKDEIIEDLVFDDKKIIATTDKKIFSLQNGKLFWEKDLKSIVADIDYYNNYCYLLLDNEAKNRLEIIDNKGKVILNKQLNEKYDKLLVNKEKIYLKNNKKIIGFTNKGKEFFQYNKDNIMDFAIRDESLIIYTNYNLLVYKLVDEN